MLTAAEEKRLEEVFPSTVDVEYAGPDDEKTSSYELTPFWTGPDIAGDDGSESPDYPVLVFDWEDQSVAASERQPADNVHRIDNPIDEEEYRIIRSTEMYSDLVIQVSVRRRWIDGIPPDVRLKQLARAVWEVCDQKLDKGELLNEPGDDDERPMLVDVQDGIDTNAEDRTLRAQWAIRLHYREEHEVVEETVSEVEYDIET